MVLGPHPHRPTQYAEREVRVGGRTCDRRRQSRPRQDRLRTPDGDNLAVAVRPMVLVVRARGRSRGVGHHLAPLRRARGRGGWCAQLVDKNTKVFDLALKVEDDRLPGLHGRLKGINLRVGGRAVVVHRSDERGDLLLHRHQLLRLLRVASVFSDLLSDKDKRGSRLRFFSGTIEKFAGNAKRTSKPSFP